MSDHEPATSQVKQFRDALAANAAAYGLSLNAGAIDGLTRFYQVLNIWNPRLHLVAPVSPREFATRHILESLALIEHLPDGARIADLGSGGGLPAIPCLVVRPDLCAVLIEASPKKAVFLREAFREVLTQEAISRQTIIAERFENIGAPQVDFITCRALEKFEETISTMIEWAPSGATFLLFGGERLGLRLKDFSLNVSATLLPNSERRFLFKAEVRA